jgi:hypothetical protein
MWRKPAFSSHCCSLILDSNLAFPLRATWVRHPFPQLVPDLEKKTQGDACRTIMGPAQSSYGLDEQTVRAGWYSWRSLFRIANDAGGVFRSTVNSSRLTLIRPLA